MDRTLPIEKTETDLHAYKVLFFVWFLFLFEPARLISHYFPVFSPLKWIPTLLLLYVSFRWMMSPLKKYIYKWFALFLIVNLFGTFIAFIYGNWGIARGLNRQIIQFYLLGVTTLTFFNDDEKIDKLFLLYFFYILYYAMWGIVNLEFNPINADLDPGSRSIVPWHHQLDNRDGFGPLMAIGFSYTFYYFQATESRRLKIISIVGGFLCLGGIVLSFGRGVFLSMLAVMIYIWAHSKRKVAGIFLFCLTFYVLYILSDIISSSHNYWETMESIKNGSSTQSGSDRITLWGWAWREFINNPIFGVGTGNFGIAIFKYVSPAELMQHGYRQGNIWGRVLHSVPMTVLCEHGISGIIVFFGLIFDYSKSNNIIRNYFLRMRKSGGTTMQDGGKRSSAYKTKYYMSLGVSACLVAFFVNAIFYDLLYYPFLWNLIIMNKLIYISLLSDGG